MRRKCWVSDTLTHSLRSSLTSTGPLGTWLSTTGATDRNTCTKCVVGKYGDTDGATAISVCKDCTVGLEYQDVAGQPSCKSAACSIGKYGTATNAATAPTCTNCAAGRYSGATGLTSSESCNKCKGVTPPESQHCSHAAPTTLGAPLHTIHCLCPPCAVSAWSQTR